MLHIVDRSIKADRSVKHLQGGLSGRRITTQALKIPGPTNGDLLLRLGCPSQCRFENPFRSGGPRKRPRRILLNRSQYFIANGGPIGYTRTYVRIVWG